MVTGCKPDKYKRQNQTDKFTLNQSLRADFSKDLYLKLSSYVMYDEGFFESFNQDFRSGILSLTNPNTGWNRTRASSASFDRTTRLTHNAILNYNKTFLEKNTISAMAGFEYYDAYNNKLYIFSCIL